MAAECDLAEWFANPSVYSVQQPALFFTGPPSNRHEPLQAAFDIRFYDPQTRQTRSLREQGVLPVCQRHKYQLDVRLNRPAHVYLLWISPRGEVAPVYPWKAGSKWEPEHPDEPVRPGCCLPRLTEKGYGRWGLTADGGVETVVLLAREEPLSAQEHAQVYLLGGEPAGHAGAGRPVAAAVVRLHRRNQRDEGIRSQRGNLGRSVVSDGKPAPGPIRRPVRPGARGPVHQPRSFVNDARSYGRLHAPVVNALVQQRDWSGLIRYWMAHQHQPALDAAVRVVGELDDHPRGEFAVDLFWTAFAKNPLDFELEIPEAMFDASRAEEQGVLALIHLFPRLALCETCRTICSRAPAATI